MKLTGKHILILLLLGSGSVWGQTRKWEFMVVGDTRGTASNSPVNTEIVAELAQAATNIRPAFLLVPGDMVNTGSQWALEQWTNAMAPVFEAGIPVFPVLGNHENFVGGVAAFTNVFGPSLPDNGPVGEVDRTYAVTYANALVLAFDNYVNIHRANTNWLKTVLATNTSLHVFAMGHEPAFAVLHKDTLDDDPVARDAFWNILSTAAARVYFCGHDHFYDHARLDDRDGDPTNDIHQYIVGTGGAPLYPEAPYDGLNGAWLPTRVKFEAQYGYVLVEIDGPVATLSWFHRTGPNTYAPGGDVFSYSLAPVIEVAKQNGVLRMSWGGGGRLQSAPSAEGPWAEITNAVSGYSLTNFPRAGEFYRVKLR